ncbi:MAG: YheC/YheD family protein [Firmicutes bacterium]|nr:YheC/YheD family protein [Bacillota bacterium]
MARQLLIGVATTVVPCDASGKTVSRFFERLALLAREHGARLILFHPAGIDFARGRVNGYQLLDDMAARWVRKTERLPDAIYENVYVHLVVKGLTRPLRQGAKTHGIPLFNPVIFGKWSMHRFVLRHPECGILVPETRRLESADTARDVAERHGGAAYVKPIGGYGGRGVLRVRKDGRSWRIDCDRYGEGHRGLHQILDDGAFAKFMKASARRAPHIVQQQIPLIQLPGKRKVDFRVVVQRDGEGEWRLVGIVPKVTASDGVVTNLVAGGNRGNWDNIVAELGERGQNLKLQALERAGLALARKLSALYPTLGILGYDMGLDEKGRVWLIEVNPKPARSLLDLEMRRRSAKFSVAFCTYLARKKVEGQKIGGSPLLREHI